MSEGIYYALFSCFFMAVYACEWSRVLGRVLGVIMYAASMSRPGGVDSLQVPHNAITNTRFFTYYRCINRSFVA